MKRPVYKRSRKGFGAVGDDAWYAIVDKPDATQKEATRYVDEARTASIDALEVALGNVCPNNAASVLEDILGSDGFQAAAKAFEACSDITRTPRARMQCAQREYMRLTREAGALVARERRDRVALFERCTMPSGFKPVTRLAAPRKSAAFERETDALCSPLRGTPKLPPPHDCANIRYEVDDGARMLEIGAFDDAGNRVGEMALYVMGKQLRVNWSDASPQYAACGVGRTLYETARQYACESGLYLASDTTRSPFSECFWRRQVHKSRAKCATAQGSKVFPVDRTERAKGDPAQRARALAPYRTSIMQSFLRRGSWTCGRYVMKESCPPVDDHSLRGLGAAPRKGVVAKLVAQIPSPDKLRAKKRKRKR